MGDRQSGLGLLRRGWLRLVDGERPWGSFDVWHDRFGVTRYRLVVFPPGITESDRRRIRMARGWPLWGALVWAVCEIWLTDVTQPVVALALSTAAYVGSGLAAVAAAGEPRTRVRVMGAAVMAGYHDPASRTIRDTIDKLAILLLEADELLARREISTTEHEVIWWRVYVQMDATCSAASGMHGTGRAE